MYFIGYLVSMDQMEQFLSNLPYLKYLELIAHCPNDFINGQRWEMLTKSLKTFNFKFYLPFDVKSDDLDSFRTSYWLEEKCWLVAGDKSCLFSIPHFAPDHIDINKWSDKWSNEWSIKSINTITIKGVPRDQFPPYTHIKRLYINCSLSRKHILSIVELKQLEYLSILSINDLLIFVPFESTIPNLYELRVGNTVAFHMIEQLKGYQLKQIRKLLISISDKNTDLILQELFYVFSHIEHLTDLSDICTIEAMIRLIDGFAYLLNASFYSKYLLHEMKSGLYPDSNSIIQNSHRLIANNFTYRVRQVLDDRPLFVTHWWIAAQVNLSYSIDVLFIFIFLYYTAITITFAYSLAIRTQIHFISYKIPYFSKCGHRIRPNNTPFFSLLHFVSIIRSYMCIFATYYRVHNRIQLNTSIYLLYIIFWSYIRFNLANFCLHYLHFIFYSQSVYFSYYLPVLYIKSMLSIFH